MLRTAAGTLRAADVLDVAEDRVYIRGGGRRKVQGRQRERGGGGRWGAVGHLII